jgi:glycosyltransferase involved in cell wall biosynthesis
MDKTLKIYLTLFSIFVFSVIIFCLNIDKDKSYGDFVYEDNPDISVILPVYNTEEFLEQCIESALNQTFPNFELIVVNDGSTDRSADIIQKYAAKDKRIKAIDMPQNSGPAAARNTGIKHIRGKYTIFIDSDDYMMPRMLEKLYNAAEKDNLDLVMSNAFVYDMIENRLINEGFFKYLVDYGYLARNNMDIFSSADIAHVLFQITPRYLWIKLIKSSIIKDNDLHFVQVPQFDDALLPTMAMYHAKRMKAIKSRLYVYRHRRAGAVTNLYGSRKEAVGLSQIYDIIKAEFDKQNADEGYYISLQNWCRDILWRLANNPELTDIVAEISKKIAKDDTSLSEHNQL